MFYSNNICFFFYNFVATNVLLLVCMLYYDGDLDRSWPLVIQLYFITKSNLNTEEYKSKVQFLNALYLCAQFVSVKETKMRIKRTLLSSQLSTEIFPPIYLRPGAFFWKPIYIFSNSLNDYNTNTSRTLLLKLLLCVTCI